jgi:hypothetical protein
MSESKEVLDLRKYQDSFDADVVKALAKGRGKMYKSYLEYAQELLTLVDSLPDLKEHVRIETFNQFTAKLEGIYSKNNTKRYVDVADDALLEWQKSLPLSKHYEQGDSCFKQIEGDSIYILIGKAIKRARRFVTNTSRSVENAFRKEKRAETVYFHTVAWRTFGLTIIADFRDQLASKITEDARLRSHCVALTTQLFFGEKTTIREEIQSLIKALSKSGPAVKSECLEISDALFDEASKTVTYLGTFAKVSSGEKDAKLQKRNTDSEEKCGTTLQNWEKDFESRLTLLKMGIGLLSINNVISDEFSALEKSVKKPLESKLEPVFTSLRENLTQVADRFDDELIKNSNKKELKKRLDASKLELDEYLEKEFLAKVRKLIDNFNVIEDNELTFTKILSRADVLVESGVTIDRVMEVGQQPVTKAEIIEYRTEVTQYFKYEVMRSLRESAMQYQRKIQQFLADAEDIQQIVEVNLNLAIELASESGKKEWVEDVNELVHDGLDRAAARCSEVVEEIATYIEELNSVIKEPIDTYLAVCDKILSDGEYQKLRSLNREMMVRETAVNWKGIVIQKWHYFVDAATIRYRLGSKIAGSSYNNLSELLGFKQSDSSGRYVETAAADFLIDSDKKISHLPLIYRRLFASEALTESRYFKGRMTVANQLTEAFERWSAGNFANYVLIGEKGSGKTTCMNLLPNQIVGKTTTYRGNIANTTWEESALMHQLCDVIGCKKVDTAGEFIAQVSGKSGRFVVVLEGFQNIYLRDMHGFAALEAFLLVISQTSDKVFWIVTSSRYGWQYLDKIYNVSAHYSHMRFVDRLTQDVTEDVIMSRHKVSGYDLHFEPDKDTKSSRAYKKLANDYVAQQDLLKTQFFKALHEVSEGNIGIALFYWLRSIREVEVDHIVIAPFTDAKIKLGDGFSNEDLFILGALILHDDLTEVELSHVMHQSIEKSRLSLLKLKSRSILVKRDDRYYINNLLYRHLVNLLKSRNILH